MLLSGRGRGLRTPCSVPRGPLESPARPVLGALFGLTRRPGVIPQNDPVPDPAPDPAGGKRSFTLSGEGDGPAFPRRSRR
jgi:hypothetical protein